MLKNNYHTHTYLCRHAKGKVIDYAKVAYENGFLELGMSDHAPVLEDFMSKEDYLRNHIDTGAMDISELDLYFKQIEEFVSLYKKTFDKIDYYKRLKDKVDYLNLGIHFYKLDNKIINTYGDVNYQNLDAYVKNAENALKSGLYTTFCHPDLFMFGYKDKNGNRVFDEKCVEATRKICELAIKYDVYLEVNCNGFRYVKNIEDYKEWKYPYPNFWQIVKEYPVKIIVGADAHTPDSLINENVKRALDFVDKIGLKVCDKMVIKGEGNNNK